MDILNDFVLPLATSPWVYLVALLLVVLDGVFPVFPSEVVIVGLAALAASSAVPDIILLRGNVTKGELAVEQKTFVEQALQRVRLALPMHRPHGDPAFTV